MSQAEAVEKASVLELKRAIARAKRKRKHEAEINYLNITAMLDMMTIILVFMLKSLATSAGNIPQDENLQLPHSTAIQDPSGALQVVISRVSVTVNGRSVGVLLGDNGRVDQSLKRGGSNGFLINPLNSEMRNQAIHARQIAQLTRQTFKGEVAIIADSSIPMRTIYEILYTCGQNGFTNFQLMVLKRAG